MTSPLKSDLFTDNKPVSLSVKDWIIRKLAPKMMLSEKTIEAVINHQFQSASEATGWNKSVEISGFGKFLFNYSRARKKLEKHYSQVRVFSDMVANENLSDAKRRSAFNKLQNTIQCIRDLKPKLYGENDDDEADLRRVEEQFASFQGFEGADKTNELPEVGDM